MFEVLITYEIEFLILQTLKLKGIQDYERKSLRDFFLIAFAFITF